MDTDQLDVIAGEFAGPEDKMRWLIELGHTLPRFPEELRVDEHRVAGCTSRVWFVPVWSPEGHFRLQADSDSMLVRGLIAILRELTLDLRPQEILLTDFERMFERLGLKRYLSPSRSNGFRAMVKCIKQLAQEKA